MHYEHAQTKVPRVVRGLVVEVEPIFSRRNRQLSEIRNFLHNRSAPLPPRAACRDRRCQIRAKQKCALSRRAGARISRGRRFRDCGRPGYVKVAELRWLWPPRMRMQESRAWQSAGREFARFLRLQPGTRAASAWHAALKALVSRACQPTASAHISVSPVFHSGGRGARRAESGEAAEPRAERHGNCTAMIAI